MARPLKTKKKGSSKLSIRALGSAQRVLLSSLPFIFSLAVIGVLLGCVLAYAFSSPTFHLEDVRVLNVGTMTQAQAFEFCQLKAGENLIRIDLVNVQQVIKRKHPEFKEVKVRRVLPNRIEVVLKRRTPVAQVEFSRYVQVDKDLVVLPGSSVAAFKNLMIIKGAPAPRGGLFVGATVGDANAKKALKLAEIIKRSNILKQHQLTAVDISDPKNMSVWVDGDIEIRLGNSHLIERLKILDQTIRTVEFDRTKISYIDLRFDDVVIGPR
jgi:cell division septal protein FtsQ